MTRKRGERNKDLKRREEDEKGMGRHGDAEIVKRDKKESKG